MLLTHGQHLQYTNQIGFQVLQQTVMVPDELLLTLLICREAPLITFHQASELFHSHESRPAQLLLRLRLGFNTTSELPL